MVLFSSDACLLGELCLGLMTHAPCRTLASPCDMLKSRSHTWATRQRCNQAKHGWPDSWSLLAMLHSWIHSGCWAGLNTLSPLEAAALSCCAALTSLGAALQELSPWYNCDSSVPALGIA